MLAPLTSARIRGVVVLVVVPDAQVNQVSLARTHLVIVRVGVVQEIRDVIPDQRHSLGVVQQLE